MVCEVTWIMAAEPSLGSWKPGRWVVVPFELYWVNLSVCLSWRCTCLSFRSLTRCISFLSSATPFYICKTFFYLCSIMSSSWCTFDKTLLVSNCFLVFRVCSPSLACKVLDRTDDMLARLVIVLSYTACLTKLSKLLIFLALSWDAFVLMDLS